MTMLSLALDGKFLEVLQSPVAAQVIADFGASLPVSTSSSPTFQPSPLDSTSLNLSDVLAVGIAALNAFLQANVTGPVLINPAAINALFRDVMAKSSDRSLLSSLEVDGVAPYQYAPFLPLFGLARHAILNITPKLSPEAQTITVEGNKISVSWWTMRILVWHYKLLAQPNLGSKSAFVRSSQWTDVPDLLSGVTVAIEAVCKQVLGSASITETSMLEASSEWSCEEQAELLLEISNSYLMLGVEDKARVALKQASRLSGLKYVLSGALGKRTKWQEKDTSQLVVLARSATKMEPDAKEARPKALDLNDDTLLETIAFKQTTEDKASSSGATNSSTESELEAEISPDNQPQLIPLDSAILLTEASIKDAFSPMDGLTAEEVLPYAVRVLADTKVNWQIYTQALIVRSRIEVNRSRTVERGVLQLQAVVDQVVVDTTSPLVEEPASSSTEAANSNALAVPTLTINGDSTTAEPPVSAPTSFFPALKESDSAPATTRLRYINSLLTPPRWHLESELAYCWAGVGSLVSALEIFKRLRMYAEVALCLASTEQAGAEEGRGGGGESKARGLVRWRLFEATREEDRGSMPNDISSLKPTDFMGPLKAEKDFPSDAPRLFCILGDLENEASHYESAWDVSKQRYSRAQKNLGEHYIQLKQLDKAREAYRKAVHANRLNTELWGRLGDLELRLADYEAAAEAYTRAIGAANGTVGGEDARTWSNLGSALWSLYREAMQEIAENKAKGTSATKPAVACDEEEEEYDEDAQYSKPSRLLQQALSAFKRGSALNRENWRIWDNIITLAARMKPAALLDIVPAVQRVAEIRATEDALDANVLRLLLTEGILDKEKVNDTRDGPYILPRGSIEKSIYELFEKTVVPLITYRDDLWEIISRARAWRRDFAGAIAASEAAWRAAVGTASSGSLAAAASTATAERKDWTKDLEAWKVVVQRTDELVSMLENYSAEVEDIGTKWKFKARNAVRSVLGKAKDQWENTEGWATLQGLMDGLKTTRS
ncbi:TPR repeat-containing protein C19B12.01 [Ceratocystis fimbriata CBS 114723]|uniref:TPR repeat-containing protein C19B12.01 n=1 Tax=Ceratocystis fimbriata CBS 114723 TaxID=1035309 RepID=A0A2C5XH07_9PEZI|nr:TPR repeat-containing protein C19B12.01 [Ceratocystis fimbriata CBS 114723]